jgi:hypothetical protein
MGSSQALTTCQMIARGLNYKPGSLEETCSRIAIEKERRISFYTTLTLINAIVEVGNGIMEVMSKSSNSQGKKDGLKNSVEALKKMLLPEEVEVGESQARRAQRILKEEVAKGPIKIQSMSKEKKRKNLKIK